MSAPFSQLATCSGPQAGMFTNAKLDILSPAATVSRLSVTLTLVKYSRVLTDKCDEISVNFILLKIKNIWTGQVIELNFHCWYLSLFQNNAYVINLESTRTLAFRLV